MTANEGQRLVALGNRLSLDGRTGMHCGDPLDVLIAGRWVSGRIEYSQGGEVPHLGWYLCSNDRGWCPLVPGMVARQPVDRAGRWAW